MVTTATVHQPQPKRGVGAFIARFRSGDELAYLLTLLAAGTIFLITSLIVYELIVQSGPSREKFGFRFLFTKTWDPVSGDFGALPFIYGTVVTSALALLIAIPQGL